jgi:hypothetical protein
MNQMVPSGRPGQEDPGRPSPPPKPAPLGARPVTSAPKARMIDVQGMIRQASNRVAVKELLKKGKKDIVLLSREKIDELINRSVRTVVEKHHGAGGFAGDATVAQMQAESRAHFNELLRQATRAAKSDTDPTLAILQLIKTFAVQKPPSRDGHVDAIAQVGRRVVPFKGMDLDLGRGLDVGTVNVCAAAKPKGAAETVFNIQRNAFLGLRGDALAQEFLPKLGLDYVLRGDRAYIVGDAAFNLATLFEMNTRRPMMEGMLSPQEPEALVMVNHLVTELLGAPRKAGEICVYSVPGDSVEGERSFIYHRAALEIVIRNLGYTPRPMVESHLIVFAELKEQEYTGIGISCGGGKFNVCLSYKGVPALAFSTPRGGDWIDASVAEAIGMPAPRVGAVKESEMDLLKPKGRVEEAIAIYSRHLIQYTLEQLRQKMGEANCLPTFTKPIDMICAGGTSMARGFIEILREEVKKGGLPIGVGNIRRAKDPQRAVAAGCVQAALEETGAPNESLIQVAPAALARAAVSGVSRAGDEALGRLASFAGRSEATARTPAVCTGPIPGEDPHRNGDNGRHR